MTPSELDPIWAWPLHDLHIVLEQLSRHTGLAESTSRLTAFPVSPGVDTQPHPKAVFATQDDAIDRWLKAAADGLGFEAEAFSVSHTESLDSLAHCGPALLSIPTHSAPLFFAVVRGKRNALQLMGTDLRLHWVSTVSIRSVLAAPFERPLKEQAQGMFAQVGLAPESHEEAMDALVQEQLKSQVLDIGWMLRRSPQASFWRQLQDKSIPLRLTGLLGGHTLQYLLMLSAWGMLGSSVLGGRIDKGWLVAWLLLLVTMLPLQMWVAWMQGAILIDVSALVKRRLLLGVMKLEPEEIRVKGSGQLLGQVIESQAIESMIFAGGYTSVIAVVEVIIAGTVLALGAGGALQTGLYILVCLLCVSLIRRNYLRQMEWTNQRLHLTHQLVEKMVGHRTRLAQQPEALWHDNEDQELQRYIRASEQMDHSELQLDLFATRGWLLIAMISLLPGFLQPNVGITGLAVALGGILLSLGALTKLTGGDHTALSCTNFLAAGGVDGGGSDQRSARRRSSLRPPTSPAAPC